jgi:hypothetical protein
MVLLIDGIEPRNGLPGILNFTIFLISHFKYTITFNALTGAAI